MNVRHVLACGTRVACLVGVLAATGCSFPLLGSRQPPRLFDLSAPEMSAGDLPHVDWQLAVAEPLAGRALDTDRIALRPEPHELRYYAGARWSDRAPRLVQSVLVDTFERSGAIVRVARRAVGFPSDYSLLGEIREFEARLPGPGDGPPEIRVRMTFRLVRAPRGEIIDVRTFSASRPASGSRVEQVVAAFEQALGAVAEQAVSWTLVTGERNRSRPPPSEAGTGRPRG